MAMFVQIFLRHTIMNVILIKIILISGGQSNSPYCGQQFYKPTIASYSDLNFRIVGGVEAEEAEFPWMVSLQKPKEGKFTHFCGGVVISDYFILTAAHCADIFIGNETKLRIKLGSNNIVDINDGIFMRVSKIIVHELWDKNNNLNDIALYRTGGPIKYRIDEESGRYSINSICLPRKSFPDPEKAVVMGWGQITTDSQVVTQLLKAIVPKFPIESCRQNYKHLGKVTKNMLCYGGDGEKDSCLGDSGGPLIAKIDYQYFIIGIVSYGVPCAVDDYPTIYTKVIKYLDWIHEKLKLNSK